MYSASQLRSHTLRLAAALLCLWLAFAFLPAAHGERFMGLNLDKDWDAIPKSGNYNWAGR